ncbi:DNA polymerase Y family protein [Hoeflea sp. CAU 1731]
MNRSQRILSIALPCLSIDRMARRKRGRSWRLTGRPDVPPLAAISRIRNAQRIVAVEEEGERAGLRGGQSLSDARALAPDLDSFDHDAEADMALLTSVAIWCDRYTPLVAIDQPSDAIAGGCGGLFLDISGCVHLFGGEQAMLDDVTARLRGAGFAAQAAIADTAGAAWAAARYGDRRIVEPGDQLTALGGLPLAALRLDPDCIDMLGKLGLRTIGCIADLPRAPLAARFGAQLLRRLDQALGREEEVIQPRLPTAELSSEKIFAEPIALQEDIERTIGLLAANLQPLMDARQVGARRLELRLFRVDGKVAAIEVRSAGPVRTPDRIQMLFRERIAGFHEDLDAGFGFDLIRLNVLESQERLARQDDLVAGGDAHEAFDSLVDRLGARLGVDRVLRFASADTHIPERSFGLVSAAGDRPDSSGFAVAAEAPCVLTRPLLLFDRPEPVEAIAEAPDGPPVRFRWRRAVYRIVRSEGPERIGAQWWLEGRGGRSRDYYRVEDDEGHRFWIFRHGLFGSETTHPKWYMHGLFA